MKKTINIISLLALVITLFIVIISCGTGVKFNNILGSSSIGGGGNNGGNNLSFPLFFDGQYQNDYESFSSIVPTTSDGGYFITGQASNGSTIDDALFVKLNRDLTIAWSKLGSIGIRGTFGFENIEGEVPYYYACGYANNNDFFISKLNSDGTPNGIIYFSLGSDRDITFILPANNGIISNAGGISKFGFDLTFKWNISNLNWGDANFITSNNETSNNETVGYVENTSNDGWLVKLNVYDDDVSNVIDSAQDAYIYGINNISFLGGVEDNNVFYFGFRDNNRFYLIKTDSALEKRGEVSISGNFNVSLVPDPSSDNVILALYDNTNNLVLFKLDSNLSTISKVKINKFSPAYPTSIKAMYFIPLASNFLIPGQYESNGLIYTFNYNLTPRCGSTSEIDDLNLQNTDNIQIDTIPIEHPTLQSGYIEVVYSEDTPTTDYQLTELNACPIN
jgi:hypothetical protein